MGRLDPSEPSQRKEISFVVASRLRERCRYVLVEE
jgi:hypothetical protein